MLPHDLHEELDEGHSSEYGLNTCEWVYDLGTRR